MIVLLVGAAGAAGAVARFLVDTGVRRVVPTAFPVATVAINVTGSLVLGFLTALERDHLDAVRLVAGVGFCGGYTTFSTAMVDTVRLGRQRRPVLATVNLIGQPLVCVLAAALGYLAVG
ncbi:MAG: fluoride efflux transporter FluC [Nocardioidaceae bacterium]